ncbi:hypothetical protein ABA31_25090 [Agrococcus baldri]|uniref:DUF559 domain-containing protein n=2 Tax=Agrococcus baldri TaxID=153730 RepID=A0AA87RLB9_9MICO|nr:hypothetical protein ABA31_25090 [Agrococcus baldri]
MRRHAPLPPTYDDAPFRVVDALNDGVTKGRLRGTDLEVPFRRVRSAPITDVHGLASAYATVIPPHHAFAGLTAGRLWGLPIAQAWARAEPLVIARPNRSAPGYARGTRQIAYDATRLSRTLLGGLPVLEPLPTALTLARELSHEALVQVLDALLTPSRWYPGLKVPREPERGHVTLEEIDAFLVACRGLTGVPALRAAATDARVGVDSRFETVTRLLIVEAGLPEPVVHPLVVADGIDHHPDLAYPELRIAIEYEGDGHRDERQWHVDIERYARLEAVGWTTVRVTRDHLARRGAHFVARIRRAIALRER